jgi:hypothetical protein
MLNVLTYKEIARVNSIINKNTALIAKMNNKIGRIFLKRLLTDFSIMKLMSSMFDSLSFGYRRNLQIKLSGKLS